MMKRFGLFSCIFLIHNGYCGSEKPACQFVNANAFEIKSSFSAVRVLGDMDVHLHTGYRHSSVQIKTSSEELKKIQTCTTPSGILTIKYTKGTHVFGKVSINVYTHYLNGFSYHGKGTIIGEHLSANLNRLVIENEGTTRLGGTLRLGFVEMRGEGFTEMRGVVGPHMHVKLAQKAKLKMTGTVGLRRLDMTDGTWFSLSWVQSPTMIVRLCGTAYAQLAGAVNKLDAEVRGLSQLNARFLQARRTYVKAFDNSLARIATTKYQHTLASDAADIRFYNLPLMKADFMAFDGAVLDMRAFNTAFVKQITPYNE